MTKQQIIDTLNAMTDDPNEEIFAFTYDYVREINRISWAEQQPEFVARELAKKDKERENK